VSWNPYNQPPVGGVINPNFASTNVGQVTTTGDDASTIPPAIPSAPNRAQLNTEGVISVQTGAPQQGILASSANYKVDYAGVSASAVAGYKWF
jgi:hypothetical protein